MNSGHEQLDVYQVSIRYVAWAYKTAKRLKGIDRHARDQLLRASQAIPLNIAEGHSRGTNADRRRFFEIARDSALECESIQDCLEACNVLTAEEYAHGKTMLMRLVLTLTKLDATVQTPRPPDLHATRRPGISSCFPGWVERSETHHATRGNGV